MLTPSIFGKRQKVKSHEDLFNAILKSNLKNNLEKDIKYKLTYS